ncbi:putative membrane protein [Bacillus pakistanensis]|uniref:Membrane protein n=1 Tax=Rossellomorea pakistanensis TaxID=992288 RepID=A0ABS2NF30_9BACI|nr:YhgE/Pip domain-containing protein [Bacillus pakistanensis]MBM7586449.1 putative membrane protein [Bacillus pakistanensis]
MKKSQLFAEFKAIFKNKKLLIPIIAVLFIPIMYSGVFLWAFWDPYEQLEELPVAIVNSDKPAEYNGETIHLGDDLVDNLKESDQFDFHFVSKKDGYENLEHQEYYMLVEIPSTFSKNATTLLEDEPQKLTLKYVPNESYNFLSAQIGDRAMEEIKSSLSKSVTETYAETMFDKVGELGEGFETARKGASELNNGASKVSKGAEELKNNLQTLAQKNIEFNGKFSEAKSGAASLASGSSELRTGLSQLSNGYSELLNGIEEANPDINRLVQGIQASNQGLEQAKAGTGEMVTKTGEIQQGAESLANGMNKLHSGAQSINNGAIEVNNGVQQLEQELSPLLSMLPPDKQKELVEAFTQLKAGTTNLTVGTEQLAGSAAQLQPGANELSQGLKLLNEKQMELQTGLGELTNGSAQLSSGAEKLQSGQSEIIQNLSLLNGKFAEAVKGSTKLAEGASSLNNGINQLYNGSSRITDGTQKLTDGSTKLVNGTTELSKGTNELSNKLHDASEQAHSVEADEENYDMMAGPVDLNKSAIHEVPNYGTGMAPYLLSLGLFVGSLLISIVYPLKEPTIRPANGLSWFLSKFTVLVTVGILQSLIAGGILLFGLGIEVESIPLFFLSTIVTSLTFIGLIQVLVTMFGDPGRFIAIIILILQLTASAGTFPIELIPQALQKISTVLPMTYSISAFKAVISSGDFAFMWQNLITLVLFFGGFVIVSIGYFMALFKKRYKNVVMEQ